MILEAMRKAGLSVIEQHGGGKTEYVVMLNKPEKCDMCSDQKIIRSRGFKDSRTVYDLLDNTRIEKITVWLPRYTCAKCNKNVYIEDERAKFDAILPPRVMLTDDAQAFLIRQQIQNPSYSYKTLAEQYNLGKPLIAASFQAFLKAVKEITTDYWLKCSKMVVVRFNCHNGDGVCLFEIKPDTKQVGVIDVMPLEQYISTLHRYGHLYFRRRRKLKNPLWRLKCWKNDKLFWQSEWWKMFRSHQLTTQYIVCPSDPVLIEAISDVFDGTIHIWGDYADFPKYVVERAGSGFLDQLHAISPDCPDVNGAIIQLCSQLDKTVRGPHDAFVDDLQGYMYWYHRRAELEENHEQHITETMSRVQAMCKRGISYENIALQLIFTSDIARDALQGTAFSKYFVEE